MTAVLVNRLQRLADKGRQAAERDQALLWQEICAEPAAESERLAIALAEHFLLGEELTARACLRLMDQVALPEARECLALQAGDERHHADLYRRYLGKGPSKDGNPLLGYVEDQLVAWQGPPEAVILALHVILEGEALSLQQTARRHTTCRRFWALQRAITRDEARHVAFGQRYLPVALARLTAEERRDIMDWLHDLWLNAMERLPLSVALPGATRPFVRHWARRRWDSWQPGFRALGLAECRSERPSRRILWSG